MKRKYKIFPKEAILNLLILIIIWSVILLIIDKNMPQYGIWQQENTFINKDRKVKMQQIKNSEYPLINLLSSDISNGEKKKIMIVGDSYIEGDGASNLNQVWWRQLEIELHDRGYYDVEVYGVGKDGASTYNEMQWLSTTSLIEDIKPDLIIIGYVINDPEIDDEKGNPIIKHTNTVNYFNRNNTLKTIGNLFPNIVYKINNMINEKVNTYKEYNDETGYPTKTWYSVITNEKWSKIYNDTAIKPLGKYLTNINIPSFVVTTPNGLDPKFKEWYNVLSLFEDSGIKTYDMLEDFQKMAENSNDIENRKINYVNGHPGTLYTKYYAEYIANLIEKEYSKVLGQKYEEKKEYPILINDWVPYSLNTTILSQEENKITYKITYPNQDNMLFMPIKKDYLKLSLEYPVSINKIQIEGESLNNAQLYITTINSELGYDDQSMQVVGKQKGNKEIFEIKEEELVTSININADIAEQEELIITIER